jgi:hypothetical protein
MFSLAIFGSNRIAGSELEPGERAVALALFGGVELDFSAAPAPFVDVVVIALFGGVVVKVQPTRPIRLAGFSIFGGRHVEPRQLAASNGNAPTASTANREEDEEFPLDINAYAVFGGISIKRAMAAAGEASRP